MRDDEKTNEVAMKVCDGQSETMNQIPKLHMHPTVDGRNPAPVNMENIPFSLGFIDNRWCRISYINSSSPISGRHRALLDMVVHPIIYEVLYIPGGFLAGFLNHQQYVTPKGNNRIPTIHFQGIC